MPRAHDDCKFRDEWLVQDKYKDWVVKDGDPRLALGQLGYLRKSESMSGHVPGLFMCCEYHFLDGTIINFLFLINSYSKNPTTSPS